MILELIVLGRGSLVSSASPSYQGHRYPVEIIAHAVQELEPDVLGDVLPSCGPRGGDREVARRGTRILGVPTVADRGAQTVVAGVLEARVEPIFHPDSYGYRPKRSALDAVGCRTRCWSND